MDERLESRIGVRISQLKSTSLEEEVLCRIIRSEFLR